MSEGIVPVPVPSSAIASRAPRSKKKMKSGEFSAPTAEKDPQAELDTQIKAIEESKAALGYNTALQLVEAGQRGFATGLTIGLKEGVDSDASFFSQCLMAAGASLI